MTNGESFIFVKREEGGNSEIWIMFPLRWWPAIKLKLNKNKI